MNLIEVVNAANEYMNHYSDLSHGNFVTYAWLAGAVGGAVIAVLAVFIPVISSYSAKKVNKELCEKVHQENDKKIAEIKDKINELCDTSLQNHDALVRIETLLNAKIKFDAAMLNPNKKIIGNTGSGL